MGREGRPTVRFRAAYEEDSGRSTAALLDELSENLAPSQHLYRYDAAKQRLYPSPNTLSSHNTVEKQLPLPQARPRQKVTSRWRPPPPPPAVGLQGRQQASTGGTVPRQCHRRSSVAVHTQAPAADPYASFFHMYVAAPIPPPHAVSPSRMRNT